MNGVEAKAPDGCTPEFRSSGIIQAPSSETCSDFFKICLCVETHSHSFSCLFVRFEVLIPRTPRFWSSRSWVKNKLPTLPYSFLAKKHKKQNLPFLLPNPGSFKGSFFQYLQTFQSVTGKELQQSIPPSNSRECCVLFCLLRTIFSAGLRFLWKDQQIALCKGKEEQWQKKAPQEYFRAVLAGSFHLSTEGGKSWYLLQKAFQCMIDLSQRTPLFLL